MPNPQNIRPPKKGEIRNPKGRGSVKGFKTVIREFMEAAMDKRSPISKQPENLTVQQHMVLSMIGKALKGDVPAFRELVDRLEGKAKESIDVKSTGTVDLMYDIGGSLIKITNEAKKNEQEES